MRKFIFALALLSLMACQPAGMRLGVENDTYALEESYFDRLDMAPNERVQQMEPEAFYNDDHQARSEASNSSNEPTSETYLAYKYNYASRLPHGSIKSVIGTHIESCQKAGRTECEVLQSNVSERSKTNVSASFSFRADPKWLQAFLDQMQTDVKNANGKIVSNTVSVEDLTPAILDSDARLKAQVTLRDRFKTLLETQDGDLADLLAVESELARVQGEIESATAVLKALQSRVSMSRVEIRYVSEAVAVNSGTFNEVSYAFKNFLGNTMDGLGSVIVFVAFMLPWFIFIFLPSFFLIRRFWRRRKKV